jgi:trk system potassium uptake protein TrkH
MQLKPRPISPGRILLISIVCMIILGTFLLSLPGVLKSQSGVTLFDLIFTATSATCVTGLLTVPLEQFTFLGHFILLLLIQIGGLGLITLTVFLMSLFINIGLGTQLMAGQLLEIDRYRTSRSMIGFIIIFTIIIESIGAFAIFFTLSEGPLSLRIFQSLFHSVSSFCSAGFVIFPQKISGFAYNIPFLLITSILMLIGELGFIVWYDLLAYAKAWYEGRVFRCSLHTKIVLNVTIILIMLSAISLWALEHAHSFGNMPFLTALSNIIFNTISFRSTGFSTLNIPTVHLATFFMVMIIAFIGSSPGSTGSGIKTTTFAIFLAAVHSVITGRSCVEIKNRTIPNDQVFKAMAVLALSLSWLACITFCLLISEEGWRFVDIMFEAFSAFANLGLSSDFTPHLSWIGKIIVMISMLVGRIGSLTLILALKGRVERTEFHYPEERVLIS